MFRITAVDKIKVLRNGCIEDKTADGGVDDVILHNAVHFFKNANANGSVHTDQALVIGQHRLVHAGKYLSGARLGLTVNGQVVSAQNHVL